VGDKVQINFRIERDLLERLDKVSKRNFRTKALQIEKWVHGEIQKAIKK
jgi:predicted DNA-binding protein